MFVSRSQWRKCFDMYTHDIKHGNPIRWDCREWTFNSPSYNSLPERIYKPQTHTKNPEPKPRKSARLLNKPKINYKE